MNAENLKIVRSDAQRDNQLLTQVAETLESEYQAHKAQADEFNRKRKSVDVTPRNVRLSALWVIGSIETPTKLVDSGADDVFSGDFGEDKAFLESTQDGEVKWDKYGRWFTSDVPERVCDLLESGRVTDAHALLAGRDPDTGKAVTIDGDKHFYLRSNKASLVLYLLGYDRMCIDTRVFRALKPAMRATLQWADRVQHPETEKSNPYRIGSPRMDAKAVKVLSHRGAQDRSVDYWCDKLKWNPVQYHALTTHIRDELAERCDVPADLIVQVAFNTEGDTTYHSDLMDRLTE